MELQNPQDINNQNKTASSFLPGEFVQRAVLCLPDRSKKIILKRFGLIGEKKHTLDKIGKNLNITRERVRQLEKDAMMKINDYFAKEISEFNSFFQNILNKNGGIAEGGFFLDKAMDFLESENGAKAKNIEEEKHCLVFIISLIKDMKHKPADKKHKDIFYLNNESKEKALSAIDEAIKIFMEEKKAMELSEVFKRLKERRALKEKNSSLTEDYLFSYFTLSAEIGSNARHQWGLKIWPFIFPKSARDKSYFILFYKKEPLHFKTIAYLINEMRAEKKKPALAETVHNELIKDKRFVLVGRGTYALADWGYEKGTIQDIIKNILAKRNSPMKKEDIIKEVSAQRMVKPGTIVTNLKNKDIFAAAAEGMYKLKT